MLVTAIQCSNCKDIIYSRAHHDMNYCKCGMVAIDGGREYNKVSFKCKYKLKRIRIPYTAEELYDDWNKEIDKLGHVIRKRF